MRRAFIGLIGVLLFLASAQSQEQKKALLMTPSARLAAAKTLYVKNAGGSAIPFNVISSGLEGWGRYVVVDSADQADLIAEVSSPREGGGVSMTSSTKTSGVTGRQEESTTTSRDLSSDPIKLVVYDARNKVPLWSGTEQPKSAMRQKAREDNLVQAAGRLLSKFRQRVEPE